MIENCISVKNKLSIQQIELCLGVIAGHLPSPLLIRVNKIVHRKQSELPHMCGIRVEIRVSKVWNYYLTLRTIHTHSIYFRQQTKKISYMLKCLIAVDS